MFPFHQKKINKITFRTTQCNSQRSAFATNRRQIRAREDRYSENLRILKIDVRCIVFSRFEERAEGINYRNGSCQLLSRDNRFRRSIDDCSRKKVNGLRSLKSNRLKAVLSLSVPIHMQINNTRRDT